MSTGPRRGGGYRGWQVKRPEEKINSVSIGLTLCDVRELDRLVEEARKCGQTDASRSTLVRAWLRASAAVAKPEGER